MFEAVDRSNARMIQRCEQLGFAIEPRDAIGIAGQGRGQDRDGDVAVQARIAGALPLAHSARPERRNDFVRA